MLFLEFLFIKEFQHWEYMKKKKKRLSTKSSQLSVYMFQTILQLIIIFVQCLHYFLPEVMTDNTAFKLDSEPPHTSTCQRCRPLVLRSPVDCCFCFSSFYFFRLSNNGPGQCCHIVDKLIGAKTIQGVCVTSDEDDCWAANWIAPVWVYITSHIWLCCINVEWYVNTPNRVWHINQKCLHSPPN